VIHEDTMLNANVKAIARLAAMHRLPSCGFPEFAVAGGLMAYGVNFPDMDRRAATFVDKILKGAKPGDLPVERSTKFTLIINLKTAKAIGLTPSHGRFSFTSSSGPEYAKQRLRLMPGSSTRGPTPQMNASS
jgi:putative ABC transport system substrate-binding protein